MIYYQQATKPEREVDIMERTLTKRQFLKNMAIGLTSVGLLAGSRHSVFSPENEGDEMEIPGFIQTVQIGRASCRER